MEKIQKLKLHVRTYPYPDFRANNAKINFREKEKKVLDQILGAGKYDARIRPSGINGTGEHILLLHTIPNYRQYKKSIYIYISLLAAILT